jgi:ribosomal protein S18 acetylase RimI-like enzyme
MRLATENDIEACAKVRPGFGRREGRDRLTWCRVNNCSWYIYCSGDEVLGWGLISWQGKETAPHYPDLFDLYVRVDYQSQGIGTQLIHFFEQLVAEEGFDWLGLAVNRDENPRALALYQRLGFCICSGEPYLDGVYDGWEDWVVDMEKAL